MKQFEAKQGLTWVDSLPVDWEVTKVKFISKVTPGATPKSSNSMFWDGDIPFVTPADYTTEDHYIEHWSKTITNEGMDSCSTSLLPPNSVIVSNRAPIGLVALNKVPVCTNQGCKGLIVKSSQYEPEFLYRVLTASEEALNALGNGTTYQELSGRALSDFVIPNPSLDIQRSIVAFLDSRCKPIDEAIARHRSIIGKLEDYRRAVITKAVTKGLDDTAPMKDSGIEWIGKIPKDWNTKCLKFMCSRIFDGPFGSHLKNEDYVDAGVRVVRLENIRYLRFDDSKHSYVSSHKYEEIKRHTVYPSDLIMSTFVSNEIDVCRLPDQVTFAVNKADCIGIRLLPGEVASDFIQYALSSQSTFTYLKSLMHGATRGRVNTTQIKTIPLALPSMNDQIDIASYLDYKCAAISEGIDRQEQAIKKLEEYRRSLIFHAVTGRIDCAGGAR